MSPYKTVRIVHPDDANWLYAVGMEPDPWTESRVEPVGSCQTPIRRI